MNTPDEPGFDPLDAMLARALKNALARVRPPAAARSRLLLAVSARVRWGIDPLSAPPRWGVERPQGELSGLLARTSSSYPVALALRTY